METAAHLKFARVSAQKCRLVADMVRGKPVGKAIEVLSFCPKKSAKIIKQVLNSAIANAEHNDSLDVDELKVSSIYVNEAPMMKRFSARAKGRGVRVVKHSCHITVKVAESLRGN